MQEQVELSSEVVQVMEKVGETIRHHRSENRSEFDFWLQVLWGEKPNLLTHMARDFNAQNLVSKAPLPKEEDITDLILLKAKHRARVLGKQSVDLRDIVASVLVIGGYCLKDPGDPIKQDGDTEESSRTGEIRSLGLSPLASHQNEAADAAPEEKPAEKTDPAQENEKVFKVAVKGALARYGQDLTRAALDGALLPIVGRAEEQELLVETLCRRTKRNPILVGPAGVGKTAIVEGFAQRIVVGNVPDLLKGQRVIALQPSALVAGTRFSGELEKRMQALIAEASQDGIILFIDEFHSAVGSGGMVGTSDMASILKPALARGDIACIAATTNAEYRRFIEPDGALERRFQPIRVNELTPPETLNIIQGLSKKLSEDYQIRIEPDVLGLIIDFGRKYMRNRHFPDKSVDLVEQCYAHALANEVSVITPELAQSVAQRMIGMPLNLSERLGLLESRLKKTTPLTDQDVHKLVNRLQVTMRGFDLWNARPNAVVLLTEAFHESSRLISETISLALFNVPDRIVQIDLSRMTHSEDINLLLGSPPGYVGYSDSLPIHQVVQTPWCILRLDHIDQCHPKVLNVLVQALHEGRLLDGRGQPVYLSDTIVILTTNLTLESVRPFGFNPERVEEESDVRLLIASQLGESLSEVVDLILYEESATTLARQEWIESILLKQYASHYQEQDIELTWTPAMLKFLVDQKDLGTDLTDWVSFLDEHLTPEIIRALPTDLVLSGKILNLDYDHGFVITIVDEEKHEA